MISWAKITIFQKSQIMEISSPCPLKDHISEPHGQIFTNSECVKINYMRIEWSSNGQTIFKNVLKRINEKAWKIYPGLYKSALRKQNIDYWPISNLHKAFLLLWQNPFQVSLWLWRGFSVQHFLLLVIEK